MTVTKTGTPLSSLDIAGLSACALCSLLMADPVGAAPSQGVAQTRSAQADVPRKRPATLTSPEIQARVAAQRPAPAPAIKPASEVASTSQSDAPGEPTLADRVHTGVIACELGKTVAISRQTLRSDLFIVQVGKSRYHLTPEQSSTGAIRLHDKTRSVMWLQLGNKSMLMDTRRGQRLADECVHAEQRKLVEEMKKQPSAPDLLGGPAAVPPAAAASTSGAPLAPVAAASAPSLSGTPAAASPAPK